MVWESNLGYYIHLRVGTVNFFVLLFDRKLSFQAVPIVDRHRFDANLDPDSSPTFHIEADPVDPTLTSTHVGISGSGSTTLVFCIVIFFSRLDYSGIITKSGR